MGITYGRRTGSTGFSVFTGSGIVWPEGKMGELLVHNGSSWQATSAGNISFASATISGTPFGFYPSPSFKTVLDTHTIATSSGHFNDYLVVGPGTTGGSMADWLPTTNSNRLMVGGDQGHVELYSYNTDGTPHFGLLMGESVIPASICMMDTTSVYLMDYIDNWEMYEVDIECDTGVLLRYLTPGGVNETYTFIDWNGLTIGDGLTNNNGSYYKTGQTWLKLHEAHVDGILTAVSGVHITTPGAYLQFPDGTMQYTSYTSTGSGGSASLDYQGAVTTTLIDDVWLVDSDSLSDLALNTYRYIRTQLQGSLPNYRLDNYSDFSNVNLTVSSGYYNPYTSTFSPSVVSSGTASAFPTMTYRDPHYYDICKWVEVTSGETYGCGIAGHFESFPRFINGLSSDPSGTAIEYQENSGSDLSSIVQSGTMLQFYNCGELNGVHGVVSMDSFLIIDGDWSSAVTGDNSYFTALLDMTTYSGYIFKFAGGESSILDCASPVSAENNVNLTPQRSTEAVVAFYKDVVASGIVPDIPISTDATPPFTPPLTAGAFYVPPAIEKVSMGYIGVQDIVCVQEENDGKIFHFIGVQTGANSRSWRVYRAGDWHISVKDDGGSWTYWDPNPSDFVYADSAEEAFKAALGFSINQMTAGELEAATVNNSLPFVNGLTPYIYFQPVLWVPLSGTSPVFYNYGFGYTTGAGGVSITSTRTDISKVPKQLNCLVQLRCDGSNWIDINKDLKFSISTNRGKYWTHVSLSVTGYSMGEYLFNMPWEDYQSKIFNFGGVEYERQVLMQPRCSNPLVRGHGGGKGVLVLEATLFKDWQEALSSLCPQKLNDISQTNDRLEYKVEIAEGVNLELEYVGLGWIFEDQFG